tara:strand:- start:89 stop:1288 length:1200 start_codon:yes stop_codon:yes gene_type:complete
MKLIDKVILEWSYRTKKGYPDINSQEDMALFESMFGFNLNEAYTEFPTSADQISNPKVAELFKIVKAFSGLKIEDPIAIDPNKKNSPKITRALKTNNDFIAHLEKGLGIEIEDANEVIKWNGLYISFGEGSRGGRGSNSKGLSFEAEIAADLNNFKAGNEQYTHEGLVKAMIKEFDLNPNNFEVKEEGGENKRRPLVFTDKGPIVGHSGENIADTLTDLTIEKSGTKIYISLKFGGTLTFFNAGVARTVFPKNDFADGKIDTPNGVALLDTFGINNELFCRVFNEYREDGTGTDFSEYHKATNDFDKDKLFNLVESGIGTGYYMLKGGRKTEFFFVGDDYNKAASQPTSGIEIQYGGKSGKGKRIDIVFESEKYRFKINIRNKQGKLYPSHIMCDYKAK